MSREEATAAKETMEKKLEEMLTNLNQAKAELSDSKQEQDIQVIWRFKNLKDPYCTFLIIIWCFIPFSNFHFLLFSFAFFRFSRRDFNYRLGKGQLRISCHVSIFRFIICKPALPASRASSRPGIRKSGGARRRRGRSRRR